MNPTYLHVLHTHYRQPHYPCRQKRIQSPHQYQNLHANQCLSPVRKINMKHKRSLERPINEEQFIKAENDSRITSPLLNEDLGFPHPQFLQLFLKLSFPTHPCQDLSQVLLYRFPHQMCFLPQIMFHWFQTDSSPYQENNTKVIKQPQNRSANKTLTKLKRKRSQMFKNLNIH